MFATSCTCILAALMKSPVGHLGPLEEKAPSQCKGQLEMSKGEEMGCSHMHTTSTITNTIRNRV